MMTTDSATRWRDERLVPSNYDDIATLVKLARKARGRIVEFDWIFTRDDLLRLRRAVHEWGSHVVGQYKCFDARVLAAINEALGDSDTALVLNEPRNSGWVDCGVSCAAEGLFFRLRGHAPFDIVFGYGIAGVEPNTVAAEHLGPTAQETLASAVGMLGWDLHRLHDERFRPVRNALYGNALGFGIPAPELPAGPAVDIPVHSMDRSPHSMTTDAAACSRTKSRAAAVCTCGRST